MIVIPKLRTAVKSADNLERAIDLAYSFKRFGIQIRPWQSREEITDFARIVQSKKPTVVLEIGPALGGTLFIFSRVATPDATLVSIDLPPRVLGPGHPKWMDRVFALFAMESQSIQVVRGNSHESSTHNEVERILGGRKADLLFIDGDHTLEGVRADFEMYSGLVKKGGIVAFHDIIPDRTDPDCHVSEFWDEVRCSYESLEVVNSKDTEPRSARGSGIGILYV